MQWISRPKKQPKLRSCAFCSKNCSKSYQKAQYDKIKWQPKPRECDQCSKKFIPSSKNQKRCSRECADIANKAYFVKKPDLDPKNCTFCDKEFIPKTENNVFCSKDCRTSHYKYVKAPPSQLEYKRRKWLIFERDSFQCIYCGKSSIEDSVELHVDHVQPQSKGGKDVCSNLVTACSECNVSKGSKLLKTVDKDRILKEIKKRNLKNNVNPNFVIKF